MTTSVTLVLKQQGLIRARGYQTVQWMAFVPTSPNNPVVSPTPPPVATDPTAYAAAFLIRNTLGIETFERVCTPKDLVEYPQSELKYFEARGGNGDQLFLNAQLNDVLRFPDAGLNIWLQDQPGYPPYDTNDFVVNAVVARAAGSNPQLFQGNSLLLPGYTLTQEDVGRWVYLTGFASSPLNGYKQITDVVGGIATVNIPAPVSGTVTGTGWQFSQVEIKTYPLESVAPPPYGHDPRYFPTRVNNAAWELRRGVSSVVTSNSNGGRTLRQDPDAVLVRSVRVTTVEPTMQAALDLMRVTRAGVAALQQAASTDNASFTVLLVTEYGP